MKVLVNLRSSIRMGIRNVFKPLMSYLPQLNPTTGSWAKCPSSLAFSWNRGGRGFFLGESSCRHRHPPPPLSPLPPLVPPVFARWISLSHCTDTVKVLHHLSYQLVGIAVTEKKMCSLGLRIVPENKRSWHIQAASCERSRAQDLERSMAWRDYEDP